MAAFVKVTRVVGQRMYDIWLNMDSVAYMNVYTVDPPVTYVELPYTGEAVGFDSDPKFRYSPQSIYVKGMPDDILNADRTQI